MDTSTTPSIGCMEIVKKRNAETLLPIIQKVVIPGSIIHSDEWKAYSRIQSDLHFIHKTVNHSISLVDKKTNVHTQSIESYWNKQKRYIKAMLGCSRTQLNSYLAEFMWHERNRDNSFIGFCETIYSQYPLEWFFSSTNALSNCPKSLRWIGGKRSN